VKGKKKEGRRKGHFIDEEESEGLPASRSQGAHSSFHKEGGKKYLFLEQDPLPLAGRREKEKKKTPQRREGGKKNRLLLREFLIREGKKEDVGWAEKGGRERALLSGEYLIQRKKKGGCDQLLFDGCKQGRKRGGREGRFSGGRKERKERLRDSGGKDASHGPVGGKDTYRTKTHGRITWWRGGGKVVYIMGDKRVWVVSGGFSRKRGATRQKRGGKNVRSPSQGRNMSTSRIPE